MKNLLFAFLVSVIGSGAAFAQDLIVTTAGDSIPCKITRERGDYVYFTYKKAGVPTKTLMAASNIAAKHMDFYDAPIEIVQRRRSTVGNIAFRAVTRGALPASATRFLRPPGIT